MGLAPAVMAAEQTHFTHLASEHTTRPAGALFTRRVRQRRAPLRFLAQLAYTLLASVTREGESSGVALRRVPLSGRQGTLVGGKVTLSTISYRWPAVGQTHPAICSGRH